MTQALWNTQRMNGNVGHRELIELLESIYVSVQHHQQNLILHRQSPVYALPRGKRFWGPIVSELLAPFGVQWYVEDRQNNRSIWADFTTSLRPSPSEMDLAVFLAPGTPV